VTSRRTPRRDDTAAGSDLDLFGGSLLSDTVHPSPPPSPRPVEIVEPESYPGETAQSAVTVSILTQTARDVIEGAFIPLWVRGEISDFKSHRNGHWYFCLRDAAAQIRCVVWKRDQRGIPAAPDDGMQVAAFGRLTVYAARGEMQYAVTRMEAEGDGLRRKALEITRARLEVDGRSADRHRRQPACDISGGATGTRHRTGRGDARLSRERREAREEKFSSPLSPLPLNAP
jgi:hypothetical protein